MHNLRDTIQGASGMSPIDLPTETDPYSEFKSDSQLFFSEKLEDSRKCSLWLTIIFIILSWNTFLRGLQFNVLVVDNLKGKIRCEIPKLKGKTNWTFEQIKAISLTNNGTEACYYYDLDYTFLSKYPYELAYNISMTMDRDKTIECHNFLLPGTFYAPDSLTEVNIPCNDHYIGVFHIVTFGLIIGYAAGGIVADIYGRRIALLVVVPLYVVGFIFKPVLAEYYWWMCFFTTLGEAGVYVACILGELLQICHRETRSFMVIFYWIGLLFAGILKIILAKSLCRWTPRELQMVINSTLMLPILLQWYLPESPHWLLCCKDWRKMLSVLDAMNYPKLQGINENQYINSVSSVDQSFSYIVKTLWKPAFRKKILLGTFLYSLLSLIYNEECAIIMFVVESEALFTLVVGISMLVNAALIPLMLKCTTRPMSICYNLLVIAFFKCAATMYSNYSTFGAVSCSICLVLSQNAIITNGLLIMETFPTRVRGTALGLCKSAGTIFVMTYISLREWTNVQEAMGIYGWTIYAALVLIAAFICVFVSETGNVPLPDTQLQAVLHF